MKLKSFFLSPKNTAGKSGTAPPLNLLDIEAKKRHH